MGFVNGMNKACHTITETSLEEVLTNKAHKRTSYQRADTIALVSSLLNLITRIIICLTQQITKAIMRKMLKG